MPPLKPKYLHVEAQIKAQISVGALTGKLPGERMLAKEYDVSYMTVRKAINNLVEQGLLYKLKTKGTFVNAAPNSRKKNGTIGYFLDSSVRAGIASPYYSLIFHAIEQEASSNNYSLVYFSDKSIPYLGKTLAKLDGVIATCFPRLEDTIELIKQSVPVVVIDNSAADKSIPSVIIDNFNADVQSVDYIYALGHRRIGFMTGLKDSNISSSRYAGYLHGLKKYGIKADEGLVYYGDYSYDSGMKGAAYFYSLKHSPSAIICANDSMALGAMAKFEELGINVPTGMSIIGFDNIQIAAQITPALTTVRAPVQEIAHHAFTILSQLIDHEQPHYYHVALSTELMIRDTCATFSTKNHQPPAVSSLREEDTEHF